MAGRDERVQRDIELHGLHIVHVLPAADEPWFPDWSYTIGVSVSLGQPELICFGPHYDDRQDLLNVAYDWLAGKAPAPVGEPVATLWEGRPCLLRVPAAEVHEAYMGLGVEVLGEAFAVLQLVTSDETGKLPGEPGYDEEYAIDQPLL